MKQFRYIFFLCSLTILSGLISCGGEDPDPSLAETLSGTWRIQQAFENGSAASFSTSGFSLVLNAEAGGASTYTLSSGNVPLPDFNPSGNWSIGASETSIQIGTGANAITATLDKAIPTITVEWVDDRDKAAISYRYVLEK